MADMRIGSGNFFQAGLDGISHLDARERVALPAATTLFPGGQDVRPQLEALLRTRGLDSFLEDAVRPAMGHPGLLLPGRFQSTLDSTRRKLATLAEGLRADDPEGARVLNRAARLLTDESDLRGLLQMYRALLHQG